MKAKRIAGVLTMLCLLAGPVLRGQTPPADAPKPDATPAAPPAPPVWSAGPIDFSGLVDAYYNVNFNHPVSQTNQLRNFDTSANQFSLNMAKLSLSHSADPVGFQVDFGFGNAFDIVHAAEPGGLGIYRHIEQAYGSVKLGKGTLDFGKYVTAHGAEVIETHSNWNYSRSLLFAWAIPYYHFGLRYSYPISKTFTGMVHLVNGWNNVKDNNSGKSVGFGGIWTPNGHFTWANNYMVGPENAGTNEGLRHMYDTTMTVTVNDKLAFMGNFDHGSNSFGKGLGKASWRGLAGYAKLSPTSWFALIPRGEWFDDHDGFNTGTKQKLKEFTLTAEFKMKEGLLTRLEYRTDFSDQKFFDRGNATAARDTQTTLLVGLVAYFGPKR